MLKHVASLLNEDVMKIIAAINGFPHLCYVTKENILQLYSTSLAASAGPSKIFTPFYGMFLHEAAIQRIELF